MKYLSLSLLAALLIAGAGCKTAGPFLTPQAIQSNTALATSLGLAAYPQYRPAVSIARDVICHAASTTNIDPAQIVNDLATAGVTNKEAVTIAYAGLILFDQVYTALGSNTAKARPSLQAVCDGLSAGLGNMATARRAKFLRP